jgi:hypothetical protein
VRIEPVTAPKRVTRRPDREDDGRHRGHSDEAPDEQGETEDDGGLHIDVLA